MEKVEVCDQFKAKDKIHSPDERIENIIHHNDVNYLSGLHSAIEKISLNKKVPKEVAIQFETARNVLLYSYFSYRMTTVAHLFIYSVLEKAIRDKHKTTYPNETKYFKGLKDSLVYALKKGWIQKKDFYFFDINNDEITKTDSEKDIDFFVQYRNELAHSPQWLLPPFEVAQHFTLFQKMINRMFS